MARKNISLQFIFFDDFRHSGLVVLLNIQRLFFFVLKPSREKRFGTAGPRTKHVTVSHLVLPYIFFSFFRLPLTFCLSVTFSSHSGPQNKDSRESLRYDGEEKEVNLFTGCSCVAHNPSCCPDYCALRDGYIEM